MAIDPKTIAAISGENVQRGLSNIGSMYAKGVQMKQNRESVALEGQFAKMKMDAIQMEAKRDEVSFMGDIGLSMKAYYDKGGDKEGAQKLWASHAEDAVSLGYEIPEQVPDAGMAEGIATKSKQYVSYLNATKASDSAKKFQVIATIAAIPENKRTPAQQRMFEALTKPSISINIPQPTKRTAQVAKNFLKTAKKGEDVLKGEIEGEEGYRDAVSTRAQAIQTEREKVGDAISLTDAMAQAHEELQHKLVDVDPLVEAWGFTPFSKKFIYNPDAELTPKDTGDAIEDPASLEPGESGVFNGIKYQRTEAGKLQKAKSK